MIAVRRAECEFGSRTARVLESRSERHFSALSWSVFSTRAEEDVRKRMVMSRRSRRSRSLLVAAAGTAAMVFSLHAADPANFKPDGSFKGSALTGFHVVGDADWTAQNGELIGKAKPGTTGGWLVMDKSFQDVQLYMNYKCTGECKSGVLLRAQKTPDGGMTGVFVALNEGDTAAYSVTLDATGKET